MGLVHLIAQPEAHALNVITDIHWPSTALAAILDSILVQEFA
jgi:hypothetical protein